MKLDDGRLTFVAQQEVTALDAIHKAVLGKAACAGRVTEGVGTCISIHAPTWGATYQTPNMTNPCRHFNPRTHVGCDQRFSEYKYMDDISIHAPTWGATIGAITDVGSKLKFQSTHPRGVRLIRLGSTPTAFAFQSTHPRGVRPSSPATQFARY